MAIAVVIAIAVLVSVIVPVLPVTALIIISAIRLIMRDIHLVVPIIMDEIDRPAAGVIFGAVLAPVFCLSGRNMQIERLLDNMDGSRPDYHGLGVDHCRPGSIPDVNLAVKARLPHCYRNIYIGRGMR
jgi:hypothetical protein